MQVLLIYIQLVEIVWRTLKGFLKSDEYQVVESPKRRSVSERIMSNWGGLGVRASSSSWNGLSSFRLWAHEICLLWKVDFCWSWSRTNKILKITVLDWRLKVERNSRIAQGHLRNLLQDFCDVDPYFADVCARGEMKRLRWGTTAHVLFSAVALFQWRVMSDF